MADELFIYEGREDEAINWFAEHIQGGGKKVVVTSTNKRSISQNALQHSIYGELSRYLISKGRTDCDADWVKAMLKNKFLGWEVKEFTDVVTGDITPHTVLRSTSKLDKGDAYHYTSQIIAWAADIGLEVRIPAKCEYRELQDYQNA